MAAAAMLAEVGFAATWGIVVGVVVVFVRLSVFSSWLLVKDIGIVCEICSDCDCGGVVLSQMTTD